MSLLKKLANLTISPNYDNEINRWIQFHLNTINENSLTLIAKKEGNRFIVFNFLKNNSMILKNKYYASAITLIVNNEKNRIQITMDDNIKTYNKNSINYKYLYKLFKDKIKSIGDIKPICNDNTMEIYYEW